MRRRAHFVLGSRKSTHDSRKENNMASMADVAPRVAACADRLDREHPDGRGWAKIINEKDDLLAQLNKLAKQCETLRNASEEELIELGLRPSTSNGDGSERALMILIWRSEIATRLRREEEKKREEVSVTKRKHSFSDWLNGARRAP
ncbi:MAG: hypothetical protein Q8P58_01955 [Candidatus Adlerbacteria bacterium]|nr:hypothetical protein [Candidatus Adlerbacteria bacterium]